MADDYYAHLCRRLVSAGIRVAVDTSGPALLAAVAAGPTVVKPNREELAEAVGAPLRSVGEAVEAAQVLRAKGAGTCWSASAPTARCWCRSTASSPATRTSSEPRSTVGAGDALLAGYLAAGADGPAALAEGLAWAAAAVALPGSRMPAPRPDPPHRREPARPHEPVPTPRLIRLTELHETPDPRIRRLKEKRKSMSNFTPTATGTDARARIQRFGGYLSGMVMPNIGAFIAFGLITALFIPDGWTPNADLAEMVGPMIVVLIPTLVAYTGGKMVHGQRGAVIGAVATFGAVVAAADPVDLADGSSVLPFGGRS